MLDKSLYVVHCIKCRRITISYFTASTGRRCECGRKQQIESLAEWDRREASTRTL